MNRIGVICLALLMLACQGNPSPATCGSSENYVVQTDDGAIIHLHRHASTGPPVLVVHGISSNHYCWDLDAGRSIGTYLADAGYDAWLLDLRGHGDAIGDAPRGSLGGDWSMDDYAMHDLPAAIAEVRRRTGADRMAYVGHSMGGMVAAAYLVRYGQDAIHTLVAVGSPVDFRNADPVVALARRTFSVGGVLLPTLDTPTMARWLNHTPTENLPVVPEEYLYNKANFSQEAAARMMAQVVSPLWSGEMRQFAQMIEKGSFISADGTIDYAAEMHGITIPTLVIAGRADRVASPDRVKPYYDSVGSPDRQFVVAARENGFQEDYGHLDLTVGDRARIEIYPLILDWLRSHTPQGVAVSPPSSP